MTTYYHGGIPNLEIGSFLLPPIETGHLSAADREDRVYVTTVAGVQVFDAAGKYLGTIKVPRQPANAGFAGPDKRVLYITAREGLYRINMLAQGPDRIGK